MNIEVTRINSSINDDPLGFVQAANEEYHYQLRRIADKIINTRNEKPVILLSGPSGSGKTTTAFMIEKILDEAGYETHTISMDNYFRPLSREEKELAALGKMDLESPERIDSELLNSQIESIGRGERIEIPKYDFAESTRCHSGLFLERKPSELVIFEGIHALNPSLITVPDCWIVKLYVSVRTRVTCGDTVLHPSKVRLARRMIRDSNFRKRSLRETMNMFKNVEAGENKYIMPYKHRADFDIDTFMAYELNAYRSSLVDKLSELSDFPELNDLTEVLENLAPLNADDIPNNSLICEFLGRGQFEY